ncbi:MAG: chromosome segregation protein SMC [Burkholderiales bacterium]
MRLTQLKLAGFKSFVDPTSINVPGQLVGVVGPNGCGKSNIIDAVRWVLGESRASALRGDSMQDVIFNGSAQRNPVARASVELHFDNRLGKASGAWSQYAEIAVKRTLQRDGESNYFINNTHVRRRDVQDIFLGTGLGPRAYAIIEQGMISRIIEAKPEESRVFLEEAAGISKYKERRKETEHRLSDTRENLARVTDILQELGGQIEKLETQAEVAKRFQELSAERDQKQNLLTLLKRNEAANEAQRHAAEIERTAVEIEAETAGLRHAERRIEEIRVEHQEATQSVNAAQAELYQSNTEVSGLESEIRFLADTRQRVQTQATQSQGALEAEEHRLSQRQNDLSEWGEKLEEASTRFSTLTDAREEEAEKLPQMELEYRTEQGNLSAARDRIAELDSSLDLEQTHAVHSEKTLQNLETRKERLVEEARGMVVPDRELMSQLEQEISHSEGEISRQEALLEQLEDSYEAQVNERDRAMGEVQTLERELSAMDSKLETLQRIQRHVEENGQVDGWLDRHGVKERPRLWQNIAVREGWETAVESVLRERLHSLEVEEIEFLDRMIADNPPSRVMVHMPAEAASQGVANGRVPLSDYVEVIDPRLGAMLHAWLAGFFANESTPSHEDRQSLGGNEILVNRDGHQFGRYGVIFHAPDSVDSGLLARKREIESLDDEVNRYRERLEIARSVLVVIIEKLEEHATAMSTLRAAGEVLKQRRHEWQLQYVRRTEEAERHAQRASQIDRELEDIAAHVADEKLTLAAAMENSDRLREELESARIRALETATQFQLAGESLERQREVLQSATRAEQDAGFNRRECQSKLEEIQRNISTGMEQIVATREKVADLEAELLTLDDQPLREKLNLALELRVSREKSLAQARSIQDELSEQLRLVESTRQDHDEKLTPLREKISELRLKEQSARLIHEQFSAQLLSSGADEEALSAMLKAGQKAAPLQGEINRLGNAIAELGAINMAALGELETSRERKQFLDAQFGDLNEALEILDNAIRRIDRETEELLQTTFNIVNGHFGELFPVLFGGGEARLERSGEDMLDSGIQVIAKPPGKKNSSIHLLSGGEKALTAIALVFAMFQLNPAPFCLLDEVDAPLDDSNTERFCELVKKMSEATQFLFISHNKITMEMSNQLVGVTMQEQGVSRVVAVDIDQALKMREPLAA